MTRARILGVLLALGCGILSALALAWSSNSLLIAGSTPATIWAPALPLSATAVILLGLVLLVGVSNARLKGPAVALWLVGLALLTHRVVDGGPDGLKDLWLGLPLTTDHAYAETDAAPHACGAALIPALCVTRGGHPGRIATVLPFRPSP